MILMGFRFSVLFFRYRRLIAESILKLVRTRRMKTFYQNPRNSSEGSLRRNPFEICYYSCGRDMRMWTL